MEPKQNWSNDRDGNKILIKGTLTGWFTLRTQEYPYTGRDYTTPRKEDLARYGSARLARSSYWIDGGVSVRSVSPTQSADWLSK